MKVVATAWNLLPIVQYFDYLNECCDTGVSIFSARQTMSRDMSSQCKFIPTQVHPSTASSQSLFSVHSVHRFIPIETPYTFTPITFFTPFHPNWNTVHFHPNNVSSWLKHSRPNGLCVLRNKYTLHNDTASIYAWCMSFVYFALTWWQTDKKQETLKQSCKDLCFNFFKKM